MQFSKEVPSKWDYYWVVDINYPDPFPAFVWTDIRYPFEHHMSAPCYPANISWIGEHKVYRFGDRIEKPGCSGNKVER